MSNMPAVSFDRAIRHLVKQGWQVTNRDQWTASLVKPRKFSFIWFLVWLLTGPGCLIYVAYYLAKPAQGATAYLQVDQAGQVYRDGKLWWRQ